MFRRDNFMPLVQLLDPKFRNVGDNEGLLAMDALRDIYALAIHNINLFRERQENQFPTHPVHEFHFGDNVSVRNSDRDV